VPAWIADAKDRTKFLIASSADAGRAASDGTVSKAKTVAKKATVLLAQVLIKDSAKGRSRRNTSTPRPGQNGVDVARRRRG
jgi:hypothetical protein